jgi:hypothetical protein
MIAVQLKCQDLSSREAPERSAAIKRDSERLPAEAPAIVIAHFRPLDPEIVNNTIPAFFIGRNKDGFWVARDVKGQNGGLFLLERSAVSFARRSSRPAGCVTIFPSERVELDLENKGNPLVGYLGPMMRLIKRPRQRMASFINKIKDWWLKDVDVPLN